MKTIKKGSRGEDVKKLQQLLLIENCDGIFGPGTEATLVAFQATHTDDNGVPLIPDGICGAKTWEALFRESNTTETMTLTLSQLGQIMPNAQKAGRTSKYIDALNAVMEKYHITTPLRMAHFLSQVAHESGELRYNEEIASGSAYEGRKDLGNTVKGDGRRFKGRGLIQLTGRTNYTAFAKTTGCDCVNHPELVAQIPWCVETAGWYWNSRKINEAADIDAFVTVTRRINGGTNGIESRREFLIRAKKAFKI